MLFKYTRIHTNMTLIYSKHKTYNFEKVKNVEKDSANWMKEYEREK
jgi:hypothetical protein